MEPPVSSVAKMMLLAGTAQPPRTGLPAQQLRFRLDVRPNWETSGIGSYRKEDHSASPKPAWGQIVHSGVRAAYDVTPRAKRSTLKSAIELFSEALPRTSPCFAGLEPRPTREVCTRSDHMGATRVLNSARFGVRVAL